MGKLISRLGVLLLFTFSTLAVSAQENVQMADGMRSNGKIYVVVAVALTILAGLFLYLIVLDRKISRFEKNEN
ncbi:MAG: CcmD family protein [Ginsengibacter sp.]